MKYCNHSRFTKCLFLFSFLLVVISVFTAKPVNAHKLGESYIYLRVYEDKLTGTFHITLRDVNNALGLQASDVQITEDNWADRIGEVHSLYKEKVQFFVGDNELPIRFTGSDRLLGKDRWLFMKFVIIEDSNTPDVIEIDYKVLFDRDPDHVALVAIEHFWEASIFDNKGQISLIFSPDNHRQQLSFSGHSVFQGFMGIVKLGIKHIWNGTDHVLFIIALILPAAMLRKKTDWQPVREFRPAILYVIKIITLFTIAHSVTLSVAALGLFRLPSRIVESVIAISIAVAALDIIFPIFKRKIGWVVFIFGLFHGFGFASVLKRLGVLGEHAALSLFGFNLGVEIGQVVIICIIFPVIYLIRHSAFYPKIIMRYGAAAMIMLAIYWFVDRAFLAR